MKNFEDYLNESFFKLKKDIGKLKKGKKFDYFAGIVSGVVIEVDGKEKTIKFDDKEYFEMVNENKTTKK